MDSRYFDLFDLPENVICVDLDTNTLSWTKERDNINLKILPKKPLNFLQNRLKQLSKEIEDLQTKYGDFKNNFKIEKDPRFKKRKHQLDLSIREAFLRFMIYIMQNYERYLRTVTRRPDLKAIDRNLATFFDCEGFIRFI
jgi:hypothetical protein